MSQGSDRVEVALLDAGVHLPYAGNLDLINRVVGNPGGLSVGIHAVEVAGVLGAEGDNDTGIAGMDWHCKIRDYFVGGAEGQVDFNLATQCMQKAVDSGARVINCCWGKSEFYIPLRKTCAYAYRSNAIVVAASGNYGTGTPMYPAAFSQGVIAVGATGRDGEVAPYSSTGPHIDVPAPGGNAYDPESSWVYTTGPGDNEYLYTTGTSLSAPLVSGVASLMLAVDSTLFNDDIEQIIRMTANNDWGTPGRLDAGAALYSLRFPYQVRHFKTSSTYVESVSDFIANMQFYDAPGLNYVYYLCRRYTIRADVTFPHQIFADSWFGAWGRGVETRGYSQEAPNYSSGYAELVPGSLSGSSASFRTYVYKLWFPESGWVPNSPSNVKIAYTVTGQDLLVSPSCAVSYDAAWDRITVTWDDNSDLEDEYVVEQKAGGDTLFWRPVATLAANSTTWQKTGDILGSETYEFHVRADQHGGAQHPQGGASSAVKIPPRAPSCVSGYCVMVNPLALPDRKTDCPGNSSSCGGPQLAGSADAPTVQPPPSLAMPNAVDPFPESDCVRSNMYVLEWRPPVAQKLGSVRGYSVVSISQPDPGSEFYSYGALTTRNADTICRWVTIPVPYRLSVVTIDTDGDTSAMGGATFFSTGSYDYCTWVEIGNGTPRKPEASQPGSGRDHVFSLGPNRPNPFNGATLLQYVLAEDGLARLEVFDILGRLVKTLVDGPQSDGIHEVTWDGADAHGRAVASGMYFYRLTAGKTVASQKMILLK